MVAAVGAGGYKNVEEACAATIRVVSATSVDRKAKRAYDQAFPIYQDLYQSLKQDFKNIAKLT